VAKKVQTGDASEPSKASPWKTFAKRCGIIFGAVAVVSGFLIVNADTHQSTEAALISVMESYDMDGASLDSYSRGVMSVDIAKNGRIHHCRGLRMRELQEGKPITCEDGTVITKK
jgi:hypothetical protein